MYKWCLLVCVLYSFDLSGVNASCEVEKKYATCDSLNIPNDIYNNVDNIVIRDVKDELLLPLNVFRGSKFDVISITDCRIPKILSETFVNLNVKRLSLSRDGIEQIQPGAFKNLSNIDKLLLRYNNLKSITGGIYNDLSLSSLTFSSNAIATVEDLSLKGLKNLKNLHLDNNRIESIFIHKIIDYPNKLQILWLHNNTIRFLTNFMLKDLTNLTILNLAANLIETIEPGTFEQTPQLRQLILTGNRLKEIDGKIFPRNGSRLGAVYLDHNQLMFLSSNVFVRLNSLKAVTLAGNPWSCPCLEVISRILYDNQIKEKCQFEFGTGEKPVCINEALGKECAYSYNAELREKYFKIVNETVLYSKRQWCFI